MPTSWDPTPVHEIPNAKADKISVTFNVADGHPAVTVDQILPSQAGDPAGPNKPSGFTITFAEPIVSASFDASDLSLVTSTAAGAALGVLVPVTPGSVYTVPVTATGDGKITLEMAAGAACAAGHYSGSCDAGFDTETPTYDDNEITWDQTGPAPTIAVKAGQANPTAGATVTFEVDAGETFSSSPASFTGADIDLTGSTATTGSPTVTWQGLLHASMFDVSVPVTSSGDVVAKVMANAYVDTALNPNTESGTATVAVDQTQPTVIVAKDVGQTDHTSTSPIIVTATFSEDVSGFDSSDVSLAGTTAGGTIVANVSGGPTVFQVEVSGMTTSGDVVVGIPAGAAQDGTGNVSTVSSAATIGWVQVADSTKPDVTIDQAAGQADPTSASSVTFDVVFSEPVTGFATGDVTLGGTAGATAAAVSGSGTTYTVSVSGMSVSGTVTASIGAGKATDGADNPNDASTSTDNAVQWNAPPPPDTTKPTVTIEQAAGQQDPAYGASVKFKVTFSEPVTGFGPEDAILGGTALPTGVTIATGSADDTVTITGGPSVYTVAVTGMTKKGTVTIGIAAGGVLDLSGNPNVGSTPIDSTVTWLGLSRPTPTVSTPPTDTQSGGPAGRQRPFRWWPACSRCCRWRRSSPVRVPGAADPGAPRRHDPQPSAVQVARAGR